MKDNVNKMLPDPQFEKLGWQGWNYFKSAFEEIKKDYDKYGDVVLEKCLGESIDIYKDAFSSEKDFIGEIRKIWKERYHYVADTLDDIISLYEKHYENGFFRNDFLGPDAFLGSGNDKTFALTASLYYYIEKKALEHYEKRILVIKGSNLYKFTLEETNGGGGYNHIIKMEKIKVIKLD